MGPDPAGHLAALEVNIFVSLLVVDSICSSFCVYSPIVINFIYSLFLSPGVCQAELIGQNDAGQAQNRQSNKETDEMGCINSGCFNIYSYLSFCIEFAHVQLRLMMMKDYCVESVDLSGNEKD